MPHSVADNFKHSIDRVLGLLELHTSLTTRPGRPEQDKSDLLRGAVVLCAAALDEFVLESVITALPKAAKKKVLGGSVSGWVKNNPAAVLTALSTTTPVTVLVELGRTEIGTMTFQRAAAIEGVLTTVLGAAAPWAIAADAMTALGTRVWTDADVQAGLDRFIERRHRIAHSGDRSATGAINGIQRPYVYANAQLILNVGLAIDKVIEVRIA
jgi:hypothetical protein